MAAYTTALFRVMIAFLFSFHPNAVLAKSENCITVETTCDKCRSADYITVDSFLIAIFLILLAFLLFLLFS